MLCYAKSLQSCPTLCDPIDCSPPGSPVPGILQARTLELVPISFSNAWKWKVKEVAQSCPTLSDPMDDSLPGSSIYGIFQARVLEWVPLPSPYIWASGVYSRVARLIQYSKFNQCNSPGEQGKEEKPHDHLNWGRKYIWQHSTPIHDRNSQKTKTRVEFPQLDKEHLQK